MLPPVAKIREGLSISDRVYKDKEGSAGEYFTMREAISA